MLKKHIVIIGGGWAGIRLVQELKHHSKNHVKVTLVSNEQNFRYSAALYRVATGHKEREAIIPIHELVSNIPNTEFIKATMTNINPSKRTISLGNGATLHYDYAVIAIGSVTTYFGIPGLAERSYSIKTQKDLRKFRTHIHHELMDEMKPDTNYVVVGAGPTGVELSAAMASYMKAVMRRHGIKHRRVHIELVEAAPRVLPMSDPKASKLALKRLRKLGVIVKLNSKVENETEDSLIVDGKSIPTKTVIWTSGVMNNPFFSHRTSLFNLNNRGKVLVDDHLQTHHNTYVIGDNAVTPFTGLGLTAVHNASYVAHDISKKLKGDTKTSAYKPLTPATVVPVGKNWAVFQYKTFVIGGWIAGLIRSFADLVSYKDIAGFSNALKLWMHSSDLEEQCTMCKTSLSQDNVMIAGFKESY